MDNPSRVIISLAVVFVSAAFIGLRAYYAAQFEIAVLQHERQFTKDREDIVAANHETELARLRDSHETEIARRHAQFEAETLKNQQVINELKTKFEKQVSIQVDDNEEELSRQRARCEEEIENCENRIKNCQTGCKVGLQDAKLVDNRKGELSKQRKDCERRRDYFQQQLRAYTALYNKIETDLRNCKEAESNKGVQENALELATSIICSQMVIPIAMCQQRLVHEEGVIIL